MKTVGGISSFFSLRGPHGSPEVRENDNFSDTKDRKVFDLEKQRGFQGLSQGLDLFFRLNPDKIAIDKSPLQPELFTSLRVAVDRVRPRTIVNL